MERVDHATEAIKLIDEVLDSPPITIEHSLMHAVMNNRMTMEEAIECLDAYEKCFES